MNIIEGLNVLEKTPIKEGNDVLFAALMGVGFLVAVLFVIPMCQGLQKKNKKMISQPPVNQYSR